MVSPNYARNLQLKKQRVRQGRARSSYRTTTPAPIGGWNTRDAVANMSIRDAVELTNWVVDGSSLKPRKGYTEFATGIGSYNVDTLAPFVTSQGANKFLAAGGGSIYDVTTGTASSIGSGYANNEWDTVAFNNHLILVNGADQPQDYDGSSLSNASYTSSIPPDRFFAAHVFKNRVLYAASDELAFWYTELFASTGIVTKFPLAGIAEKGGSVVAINSWTVDGGSGPDDFLAVFTSEGEVLVYQGTDPGTDFAIVGRFYIGTVLNNRSVEAAGGKLRVIANSDYVWLPDALSGITRKSKLSGVAQQATRDYKNNKGWQVHFSPSQDLLIHNAPISNKVSEQHVINLKNGTASRFDIPAKTWKEFSGALYFGGTDGKIYKYGGLADNGSSISCACTQAPTILRSNAEKIVSAYRPRVNSTGDLTTNSSLVYDFKGREYINSISTALENPVVLPQDWPWDWPSTLSTSRNEWNKGSGRGTYVQLYLQINASNTEVEWFGTDFIAEPGGILM